MSVEKIIKPNKLIEYFDEEIRETLYKNKLYDVNNYGWLNHDTEDPEYEGYANWHMRPNIEFDHDAFWNNKPFKDRPSDLRINMMAAGYDFMEIMKAAWLTIGQALFFKEHEQDHASIEINYSTLNLISAITELNIASDRIRDFLIFALAKVKYDDYKNNTNQPHYTAIFDESYKYLKNKEKGNMALRIKMNKATAIANRIKGNRKVRNNIIHELASNNASIQRDFLKEQQKWHDKQKDNPEFDIFSDRKGYKLLLEDKFEFVSNWYLELIEIGNCVFQIEYLTREQA